MNVHIYTSGYNCGLLAKTCVESINQQSYQKFTHYVVDDASDDDTFYQIVRASGPNTRPTYNAYNLKWLRTAEIHLKPNDDDIVIIVDLDDYLLPNALETIVDYYRRTNCWVTYGNFSHISNPTKLSTQCKVIPNDVLEKREFRAFAQQGFFCGHPQTFKGFLWNNLTFKNLLYNGAYPSMGGDSAVMMPILEMCQPGKIQFIPDNLYVYNDCRSLNDHNIDSHLQWCISQYYYKQSKYPVLNHSG